MGVYVPVVNITGSSGSCTGNAATATTATTANAVAAGAVGPAGLSGAQSGSAPVYGARAWVNFNGTGTPAIRASGDVSSITDNATGDFTVNFSTAMQDADYAASISASLYYGTANYYAPGLNGNASATEVAPTTSACRFSITSVSGSFDPKYVNAAFYR